jgi:hypothetical protein
MTLSRSDRSLSSPIPNISWYLPKMAATETAGSLTCRSEDRHGGHQTAPHPGLLERYCAVLLRLKLHPSLPSPSVGKTSLLACAVSTLCFYVIGGLSCSLTTSASRCYRLALYLWMFRLTWLSSLTWFLGRYMRCNRWVLHSSAYLCVFLFWVS